MKIGITGEAGFIGRRLAEAVGQEPGMRRVPFEGRFFDEGAALARWVAGCDVVVHLAARNRPTDDPAVFQTNVRLAEQLIRAMECADYQGDVLFASSIREGDPTTFGRSKKACRELFEAWTKPGREVARSAAPRGPCSPLVSDGTDSRKFVNMLIPNVFGEGARVFDNSFIATFCWQLIHGEEPTVTEDRVVPLVHVGSLCGQIVEVIRGERREVAADFRMPVSRVLRVLAGFWEEFKTAGVVSLPSDGDLADLRRVFMSYL